MSDNEQTNKEQETESKPETVEIAYGTEWPDSDLHLNSKQGENTEKQ